MLHKIILLIVFFTSVLSRHVTPRFADLDEEDQHLYRAAYETPAYDHDEYEEDNELPLGKLDLLKDTIWAIKAKIKEIKAFNKALAANLLATKLKVKELIMASSAIKKHHLKDMDKKKPSYNYNYQPQPYPQYSQQPQYNQQPQYGPEYNEPQYSAPHHTHDPYYGQ